MVSSQKFIPIDDIKNDLILLKDGSVGMVIVTSAVNFGLLFETEQMAIIDSFAGLLNSLSFPIQIIIYSKRMDVSSYLKILADAAKNQNNPLLQKITLSYRSFVEGLIKEKNVLDKQFYICINITSIELGLGFKNKEDKIKKALIALIPRRDHTLRQLNRLGLKARQLDTIELVKLFYDWYNPPVIAETITPSLINVEPKSSQPTIAIPTPVVPTPPTLPPQPVQFTPTPNTQIRIQPTPPNLSPTDLPQLATMPTPSSQPTPRTNTPFVVEELNDE